MVIKNNNLNHSNQDLQLLVLAMGCIGLVDGEMNTSHVEVIKNFAEFLPEFQDCDFYDVWNDTGKIFGEAQGDIYKAVHFLDRLSHINLKKRSFIIAVDLAGAFGYLDDELDQLLAHMRTVLKIEETFANQVIKIFQIKYTEI